MLSAVPPVSQVKKYTCGMMGAEDDLVTECLSALPDTVRLTRVTLNDVEILKGSTLDLLVVVLNLAVPDGLQPFLTCRSLNPTLPVIILATGANASLAAELLKCGAEDFCELPIEPNVLARKLLRALDLFSGTTLAIPLLEPFATKGRVGDSNGRRVYRAPCTSLNWATTQIHTREGLTTLRICDVSLPSDQQPGGMGLFVRTDLLNQAPVITWRKGGPFKLQLRLAGDTEPLNIQARMVGDVRPGPRERVVVGIRYLCDRPADLGRIERFWMRCQRAHTLIPLDD